MRLRYDLDFFQLPEIIRQKLPVFLKMCRRDGAGHIADLYGLFYRMNGRTMPFDRDQFGLNWYELDDSHHLLYIDLPDDHTDGMCSLACIAVYDPQDESAEPEVYHVELSPFNTCCIGQMSKKGHSNYGMASRNREENIARICRILGIS